MSETTENDDEMPVGEKPKKRKMDLRSKEMSFRLRPSELVKLQELAEEADLSIADYVRRVTLGRSAMRYLPQKQELAKISLNISKLGANINKIAKHLNTSAKVNGEATIADQEASKPPLHIQLPYLAKEIDRLKHALKRM